MSAKITITLSSANMGDVDEIDFDLWSRFVGEKIDEVAGVECEVEQARFGEAGRDRVVGGTEEQRDTVRAWLSGAGWDLFCGEAWETMRAERDAAA